MFPFSTNFDLWTFGKVQTIPIIYVFVVQILTLKRRIYIIFENLRRIEELIDVHWVVVSDIVSKSLPKSESSSI